MPGIDFTLIEADGTPHPLTGLNYGVDWPFFVVERGAQGLALPAPRVVREEIPFDHGTRRRAVKVAEREVDLPILAAAPDAVALYDLIGQLSRWLDPTRGAATLRCAVGARTRDLGVVYQGGLPERRVLGASAARFVLTLGADDPYWYDTAETQIAYTLDASTQRGLFPFFPLVVSSAVVFAVPAIVNPGDAPAWPVWTVTGPGADLALRNTTTGEALMLPGTIAAGEVVTVDTRPGAKTVTRLGGTTALLDTRSSFWALARGQNALSLELANATAASSIQLSYKARWWAP